MFFCFIQEFPKIMSSTREQLFDISATHHVEVQYLRSEILQEIPLHGVVSVGRLVTARTNHNIVRGNAALQVILFLLQAAAVAHAALVLSILGTHESVRCVARNVTPGVCVSANIRNVRNTMRILHLRGL
jgi:hypothetical protein